MAPLWRPKFTIMVDEYKQCFCSFELSSDTYSKVIILIEMAIAKTSSELARNSDGCIRIV